MNKSIRQIEKEIDKRFQSEELFKIPIYYGLWLFMFVYESLPEFLGSTPAGHIILDQYKFGLQQAYIALLKNGVKQDSFRKPNSLRLETFKRAYKTLSLANEYSFIITAFVCYSRCWAEARVVDNYTVEFKRSLEEVRYDALDRISIHRKFAGRKEKIEQLRSSQLIKDKVLDKIFKTIKPVYSYEITCSVTPEDIKIVADSINPFQEEMYLLPQGWSLKGITIGEFRRVWLYLKAYMLVNSIVHYEYEDRFSEKQGFLLSKIIIRDKKHLCEFIQRVDTNLSVEKLEKVIKLMTFEVGDISLEKMDPSLQPLISLGTDKIACGPLFIDSLNMERNTLVLLSRHYKSEYDKTTGVFSSQMTEEIKTKIQNNTDFIVESRINFIMDSQAGDIDLVILDKKSSVVLFVELKWTLDTAETFEIIEKSEKLEKKGKEQIARVLDFVRSDVKKALNICFPKESMQNIECQGCVVLRGFHGTAKEWDPKTPIIEENVFLEQLFKDKNLKKTFLWLQGQAFLPEIDNDLVPMKSQHRIGKYLVIWDAYQLREKYLNENE